jgi:hypothetical protein
MQGIQLAGTPPTSTPTTPPIVGQGRVTPREGRRSDTPFYLALAGGILGFGGAGLAVAAAFGEGLIDNGPPYGDLTKMRWLAIPAAVIGGLTLGYIGYRWAHRELEPR